MTTKTINWELLGHNVFLFGVGALMAWNAWRSKRNSAVLDKVHVLVNHQMVLQKKALAEVTSAKAVITKNPLDIEAAAAALKDYQDQSTKQAAIDQ